MQALKPHRRLGLAQKSKSLAQMNKSPTVGKVTKKRSALPVNAEWEGPN